MAKVGTKTDLAYESYQIDKTDSEKNGIRTTLLSLECGEIIKTEILNEMAEMASGRKIGNYLTILTGSIYKYTKEEQKRASRLIARGIFDAYKRIYTARTNEISKWNFDKKANGCHKALAVGLGNRDIASDSLGQLVLENLVPSAHLRLGQPLVYSELGYDLALLFCQTLGKSGVLSSDLVKGVLNQGDFDLIIAIDSLLTKSYDRLLTTVQITDTGILPGGALGRNYGEISYNTVGVPVISIGVPTVISAEALDIEADEKSSLLLTPDNVEVQTLELARVIADGICEFLKQVK